MPSWLAKATKMMDFRRKGRENILERKDTTSILFSHFGECHC